MSSFFFRLGQRAAPYFFKTRWLYRSITGSEVERVRAENEMGIYLAATVLKEVPRDRDPETIRWLNWYGERLVETLADNERRFRFIPVLMREVNAFALPGGFIFVSRPLLELCAFDEDEVIFVLGHEMGHIAKFHAFDRLMASEAFGLLTRRILAGAAAGSAVRSLLSKLISQGYSRENEFEADNFAAGIARRAGFDPSGGIRLFRRMAGAVGDAGVGGSSYFASHPPYEERIAEIERFLKG